MRAARSFKLSKDSLQHKCTSPIAWLHAPLLTTFRLPIPLRDGDRSDQMVSDRSSRVAGYLHRGGGEGGGRRVGDRTVSAERSPGARWWTISSTVMVAMGSSCRT